MKVQSDIYPVHLLYGPEDYLIQEEIQKLLNQTLSLKERGLNFHVFSGEEHSSQEIVCAAQTLPMFSPYRFVLVREADRMDDENVETLMEYITKPSPSTCLVLCGQTMGSWKKHRKEIEKAGRVTEYTRLKGRALVPWMKSRMKEKGKTLTEECADYLVEVVGDHLYDLDNTLEKVFLIAGAKERIELSDLEEITSDIKVSTVFDLTDAIGHQNLEKALGILERGPKAGDPVPLLLSMMAKQYWSLLTIKEMSSHRGDVGELAKELGSSPWNVKKLIDQGKNFSEAVLREGILKCHQADLSIKGSGGPKELLIEKLVVDLCRPNRPGHPRTPGKR
jgi:DNA polymerase-3 subunit delta